MTPSVAFSQAVDEATLITAVGGLASAQGWTIITAGGITWFLSQGSTGDEQIVGGLEPSGTRKLTAFVSADLDQNSIVSATASGYTNNDGANTTAIGAKVQVPTNNAHWVSRDLASSYTYVSVVSPDAITVLLKYTSSGSTAEGIIYIGTPEPTAGRGLQRCTYGRIASIDSSVPASTVVTLDRNINAGLKDSYLQDPYVCRPLFQSVSSGGMPVSDFALVQRIPIKSGSLTTSGGATRFSIDATASGKLTGSPGGTPSRYRAGRGVGDIVRLYAQPNLVLCGSATNGVFTTGVGAGTALAAWDAFGGQSSSLDVQHSNPDLTLIGSNKPSVETGKFVSYRLYSTLIANATTMVTQTDSEGKKNVGALRSVLELSTGTGQIPDYTIVKIGGERYRILGLFSPNGLRGIDDVNATYKAIALGPGW